MSMASGGAVMTNMARADMASCAGDWLRLAATPVFAGMALLTGAGPQMPLICSATAPLLAGMAPMYLLMSLFHATPWLTLIFRKIP